MARGAIIDHKSYHENPVEAHSNYVRAPVGSRGAGAVARCDAASVKGDGHIVIRSPAWQNGQVVATLTDSGAKMET